MHPEFDDNLIGSDPERFFGLPADWDKTVLKRAYTALIRRWKPEKFPDEFKRVRAAYETLLENAVVASPLPVENGGPAAGTSESGAEAAPSAPADGRAASEILAGESKEEALRALELRGLKAIPDALALARLRAAPGEWPGYDIPTLADGLMTARPQNTDNSPLVATVERVLATASGRPARDVLESLSAFERTPFYFDITTDLWIAFSKSDPDLCLMRLDRLIHFTDVGRQNRLPFFLLRFCVAGAMRLPHDWLRRQAALAGRFPGFDGASTPDGGRLACHEPIRSRPRRAMDELEFLEALLRMRKVLETGDAAAYPVIPYYRRLLEAYCEGNAEGCLGPWRVIAGRIFDDYVPRAGGAPTATPVMLRIRESLDHLLVRPGAPATPKTALPEKLLVLGSLYGLGLLCVLGAIAVVVLAITGLADAVEVATRLGGALRILAATALSISGTRFYYRIFRKGKDARVLVTPLLLSANRGSMDLLSIRGFLCTHRRLDAVFSTGSSCAYRVTVFQGARAASLREAYGLLKEGDRALRPKLLRRRNAA